MLKNDFNPNKKGLSKISPLVFIGCLVLLVKNICKVICSECH